MRLRGERWRKEEKRVSGARRKVEETSRERGEQNRRGEKERMMVCK